MLIALSVSSECPPCSLDGKEDELICVTFRPLSRLGGEDEAYGVTNPVPSPRARSPFVLMGKPRRDLDASPLRVRAEVLEPRPILPCAADNIVTLLKTGWGLC